MSDEIDLAWLAAGRSLGAMRDLAIAHDEDAVAEADRLLESVGSQNDREALTGEGANEFVDLLLRADVEAARRVIEDEDSGLGVQPFRQNDLLLVAAGEVEAERIDAGRADFQPVDPVRGDRLAPSGRRSGRSA